MSYEPPAAVQESKRQGIEHDPSSARKQLQTRSFTPASQVAPGLKYRMILRIKVETKLQVTTEH